MARRHPHPLTAHFTRPKALLTLVCALLGTGTAAAFEYLLTFEQVCSYQNRAFPCKPSQSTATLRQRPDGKWIGVNATSETELRQVKNDENVLVLQIPVSYSGSSELSLMKKTGRFFWSEFSYEFTNPKADEATITVGRFALKQQQ